MSVFIQRLIRLGYMVIILFIRRHVDYFVCNPRILRICLVNLPVRRLYEAVLIDSGVSCQRVDQTDIRSLRRLNRTHPSIMGIMHVTHFKSRPVSRQTARSQCRETSLVGQLTQRVILIHEL